MSEFGDKTPKWGYSESVLIHDGKAIVTPGGKQCIVALDKDTGQNLWASQGIEVPAEYGSCIAVERKAFTMLVGVTDNGLVAVHAENGRNLWPKDTVPGGGEDTSTPVFVDDHLLWGAGFGKGVTCLKLDEGGSPTVAWATGKDSEWHLGDFVIDRGHVYGCLYRSWCCIELKTGDLRWAEKDFGRGSVCWADGMLYLFQEHDGVAALATCSPAGLEIRGKIQVDGKGKSWAHPVVVGGRLYLRYYTTLYCFDVNASE
jgi:outer membrane protein assembly factor BamB